MEQLQIQDSAEKELLGNIVVRTLEYIIWTLEIRVETFDVRVWHWVLKVGC